MAERRPLLGGWQVNGIKFQSGLPFTPTLAATTLNTGTGQRPDRIADGTLSDPTVDRWFDTSAFVTPALFTYGNAGTEHLVWSGPCEFRFLGIQGISHQEETRGCNFVSNVSIFSTLRSSICQMPPSARPTPERSQPSSARLVRFSSVSRRWF